MYKLLRLKDGVLEPTSYPPRPFKAAAELLEYHRIQWPMYSYMLHHVDPSADA